jgi:hypothetical protein
MDDSSHDSANTTHPWRFQPGNSAFRAKTRRIAERLAQLEAEYDASPLLGVIARHLDDAMRGRTPLVRTRASNAAQRLLLTVSRKKRRAPVMDGALTL